jgi:Fe-S cluster biogenesis protein NfuA
MEEKIKAKLEEMRSMLQADGGDMELVRIDGANVFLKLKGACGGCPHATMTIKQGIERMLREQVDDTITVERVA